jgi:hypothetical protein
MQYVVQNESHINPILNPSRLYVGSLHFNLTEGDIKQVFEPFGELEFVDLHKDSVTGRSKGYAFVQYVVIIMVSFGIMYPSPLRYKRAEDARMALEQMDGFELAGRTVISLSGVVDYSADLRHPSFSCVSIPSTRREPRNTLLRIRWMKRAVNRSFS